MTTTQEREILENGLIEKVTVLMESQGMPEHQMMDTIQDTRDHWAALTHKQFIKEMQKFVIK